MPSTLTGTNNLDSGAGSLRAEIALAKNNTTIVFAPGLAGQTINLTSGELLIQKSLTIAGPGAGQLAIRGGGSRVFEIGAKANVTLSGLTISNGPAPGLNGGPELGGGIFNSGTLTVSGCTLSGNSAADGAGVYNSGKATVSNSTLSGNTATSGDQGSEQGGGVYNIGSTMTVSNCTLSDNMAGDPGGGIYNAGALAVSNSHFSSNTPDNIFGPYTDGGGNTFG